MPMFFWGVDPLYWLIALPAFLLGLYAQLKVRSAFERYSKVPNSLGIGGLQAARQLLNAAGLLEAQLEVQPGWLNDHYDPRSQTLRLSAAVARNPSVASLAVAAHEVGHAVQHATGYAPLKVRTGIVPVVQLGSWLGPVLFVLGIITANFQLAGWGVALFGLAAAFALVTLPVEINASSRAIALLQQTGLVAPHEVPAVRNVLSAASLTYVAALAQALSQLFYYFLILSGMRRED